MKGLAAGILGGVAGAVLWGLIAAFTGYEIGWIAWGIGALVGAGVAWGTEGGTVPGVMAVVISVLAILGGKFVALEIMMNKEAKEVVSLADTSEEYLISWLADVMVFRMQEAGQSVSWPAGVDPDNAQKEADYPPEVWAKAKSAWEAMSDEDKQAFKADVQKQVAANLDQLSGEMREKGFIASFGGIDIIFFLLAIATAFKIGSKSQTE